jgi:hydrogenase/urease accessory protein HupE
MKALLAVAAAGEAVTGFVLLAYPPIVVRLLFGAEIAGAGILMSRVAGMALIGLGVACWPNGPTRRPLHGMLTYGGLAALYLVYVGVRGQTVGLLLWPAETAPGEFAVLWRTPVLAGMRLPVVLRMPEGVRNLKDPVVQELADSLVERRWIAAGREGLAGQRIELAGLQFTITDALVRVQSLDGRTVQTIARPSQPWIEIATSQSWWQVTGTYLVEGIRHILLGADHLLFVLGLLLIVQDRWMLVKTITAFTVAHSLTLAIATLGHAEVPALPLNAAIALSILFLGPEIVRAWRGETSLTIRHPWVVAFAFGLLHGFGFASALTGAGLPRGDLPLALLSFNIGVEVGQLGFVGLSLAMERSFQVLEIRWPRWVQTLPGYTVGTLGAFWTVQRLVVLLGGAR